MNLEISTDRQRLDVAVIHEFLSERSYWAQGRPLEVTQRAIEHSLCFGAYAEGQQIAFARVVTDYATFAWLADVFVVEAYRGQGVGKALLKAVLDHPDLQQMRRTVLATRDAHTLYSQFDFKPLGNPDRYMVRERSAAWNA